MFAKSVIAFAAAAALVNAVPVEKRGKSAPEGWAYGYLEDYQTYHVRYLALQCYNQKNTQFFDDCCHPLLSTENLKDNRAAYCTPSDDATASVKASLADKYAGGASATPTASADTESESEYCDTESSASVAAATASPAAATASPAATTSKAGEQKWSPAASSATTSSTADAGEQKWAQPSTTTTQAWTPAPTTQAPKTTQAPQTTQAPSNNNGGGSHQGGYATYFYQGGNAGACGTVHGDYDMIVAIDHEQWGSSSYGSGSSTCGRWLTVTNTNNGKSVTAMVADVCPTCANGNSLDLSVGAFQAIASLGEGQVPISWSWA